MNEICDILNIKDEFLQDYGLLAKRVIDSHVEKIINRNISRLKDIEDSVLMDCGFEVSISSIEDVIAKVNEHISLNILSAEKWSFRELRIISYSLGRLCDSERQCRYVLSLLDEVWKGVFFNGLLFSLLNKWISLDENCRILISNFIVRKLKEYHGNNVKYNKLKSHTDLLEEAGPLRMYALISAKGIKLYDAPTLIGLKQSTFSYSYYSDIVVKYVESNDSDNLSFTDIEHILRLHNLDRTRKLVCATLVEKESLKVDEVGRSILCRCINRVLGDVSIAATWAPFEGATLKDIQKLEKAQKTVLLWFAQQIIEVFFEVCVQDRIRRDFWLKYVNYLNAFKIVGPASVKLALQNDSRIGSLDKEYFIETWYGNSSQTAALVLFVKNKMIVEFSNTGALYVYNQEHDIVNFVTKRTKGLSSTDKLKDTSICNLMYSYNYGYSYNEYGRMVHSGDWQTRMTNWMKHVLDINIESSLLNYKDKNKNTGSNDELGSQNYLRFKTMSKCIYGDVRVALVDKTLYVCDSVGRYAKLTDLIKKNFDVSKTRIWIKKTSEWNRIVLVCDDEEFHGGYITQVDGEILYMESIGQEENVKQINLK